METPMHEQPITFFKPERKKFEDIPAQVIPEEISIQPEVRERLKEMKGSANRYAWIIADALVENKEPDAERLAELLLNEKKELPTLVSTVLERACNLRCSHCLYQDEKSSAKFSEEAHLADRIADIVSQMPLRSEKQGEEYSPQFVSGGRMMRPSHLDIFTRLRKLRPDVRLGVIDNGTFVSLLPQWPTGFAFDWMDISIDGVEESHNTQRQSSKAFNQAIEGLRRAREVTKSPAEGGRVTSLLTLTHLNARDIGAAADLLLSSEDGQRPLADQFNITTVGPTNEVNRKLETSTEDFCVAWEQIKIASQKYNPENIPGKDKVELNIYRIEDIEKLAAAVGEKRFLENFIADEKGGLSVASGRNFLHLEFDGVKVSYQPLSIWTPEEFLIEADGAYRSAYEGQFTIEELRSGKSKDGKQDTTPYTFEQLTSETDFREAFERAVDAYWIRFGKSRLTNEIAVFQRIREKAQDQ